ncbi:ribbon-helix-helix protein, CopG family [Umezawaea sp. Da 62-37]|uniref:ribbon-helix-helix protein, CopG family n=1 Tax=Umezawaea sp. Da 62-37 TaxID=3075927 RepID=UPI0028F6E8B9|nr:ribbon-helix-helix protein, CopG family [Umezawaea sp. Da 62-37]WNV87657.1 ribbon-helix-helix protein, CopG family [Umezawaea sp. Da 62-37]
MSVRHVETNVRVPESALTTLQELCAERGRSRDAVLRDLLDEHLQLQAPLPPGQRLTHVCTLLRHPAPPEYHGRPPGGVRLRLRLDPGVADRARAVSLRLPGQPARRGHGDYQARPLADAVLTAIERARPLRDNVLDNLPLRLITHDAAKGLWELAVAASLTGAEEELHADADPAWPELSHRPARRRLARETAEFMAEALREREAWHAPYRHELVAHFVRKLLTAPDAEKNAAMLHEQGHDWEALRHDLQQHTDRDHPLLADAPEVDEVALQGRGSSAVWRARRRVALDGLGLWLRAQEQPGPAREHVVHPPGWRLRMPPGWHSLVLPPGGVPNPMWAGHLKHERLLALSVGSRTVLWPVLSPPDGGPPMPVPGVEAAFAALARRTARRDPLIVVEAVLACFYDIPEPHEKPGLAVDPEPRSEDATIAPGRSEEHENQPASVLVPATVAHELGLIDTATRDRLTAEAPERILDAMRAAMAAIESTAMIDLLDDRALAALRSSMSPDKAGYFATILRRAGIPFAPTGALWRWSISSVVEAIEQGYEPAAVGWLASWSAAALDRDARDHRKEAWDTGFVRFRAKRPPEEDQEEEGGEPM